MFILLVFARVKADSVEAFRQATIENARHSIQEPGIARFDLIEQTDDPTRFVLCEVYRSQEAMAAHKETAHYHAWIAAVENVFAEPRTRFVYRNVYPESANW